MPALGDGLVIDTLCALALALALVALVKGDGGGRGGGYGEELLLLLLLKPRLLVLLCICSFLAFLFWRHAFPVLKAEVCDCTTGLRCLIEGGNGAEPSGGTGGRGVGSFKKDSSPVMRS